LLRCSKIEPSRFSIGLESWKDKPAALADGFMTLCRSLLKAGLVDRFRVVVFPVITGSSGRDRIYDGYPDVSLDMVSSRTFDGRLQLFEYIPTLLAEPHGTSKDDA
jgi:hypothetical protein